MARENIHNTYFCLFDECEKISQDYDYRENIAFPITDFYKFKNICDIKNRI